MRGCGGEEGEAAQPHLSRVSHERGRPRAPHAMMTPISERTEVSSRRFDFRHVPCAWKHVFV